MSMRTSKCYIEFLECWHLYDTSKMTLFQTPYFESVSINPYGSTKKTHQSVSV